MLPDLRFAIGAVLAGAVLIVTAFGLAATVRIAHHKSAAPLEGPRLLAYAEPPDAPLERAAAALDPAPPADAARAIAPEAPARVDVTTMMPLAAATEAAPQATPPELPAATEPDDRVERVAATDPKEEKVARAADPPHTATVPAPPKAPDTKESKARKKVAKKRKRAHIAVEQPAPSPGYPLLNDPSIERLFLRNNRAVTVD